MSSCQIWSVAAPSITVDRVGGYDCARQSGYDGDGTLCTSHSALGPQLLPRTFAQTFVGIDAGARTFDFRRLALETHDGVVVVGAARVLVAVSTDLARLFLTGITVGGAVFGPVAAAEKDTHQE